MFIEKIKTYQPKTTQEKKDQQAMLNFIQTHKNSLYRDNQIAHVTASAIVTDESLQYVLFAYHKIYDSWAWLGGHNDGEADLLKVAIKEAKEESGLKSIKPYSNDIIALDIIGVQNHIKNGEYVPDHLHLNVTFLLIANKNDPLKIKPDENTGVKWFKIDEVLSYVTEDRMKPIYKKIFHEINTLAQRREANHG